MDTLSFEEPLCGGTEITQQKIFHDLSTKLLYRGS